MTTAITKESLVARIADLEYGPRSLKEDYTLAAYKMLLATMEAEPVYQIRIYGAWGDTDEGEFNCSDPEDRRILYKSPPARPAPVVPEDIPDSVYEILCQACGGKAWMYEEALWNACRAAMLNGGKRAATMDSDPIVDMFVAEVVKNLVDALSGPMILGPVHVSSETDHAKTGAKVAEVLSLRYPMFTFKDMSAPSFVEIGICARAM